MRVVSRLSLRPSCLSDLMCSTIWERSLECSLSEPVIAYERARNRQFPSPSILLHFVGSSRGTSAPPGVLQSQAHFPIVQSQCCEQANMVISTGLPRPGPLALCILKAQEVTTKGVYRLPNAWAFSWNCKNLYLDCSPVPCRSSPCSFRRRQTGG